MEINLTKKDIRYMVSEAVKKYLNERNGYIDNVGEYHFDLPWMVEKYRKSKGLDLAGEDEIWEKIEPVGLQNDYYLSASREDYEEDDTNYYGRGDINITDDDGLFDDVERLREVEPGFAKFIYDYIYDSNNWDFEESWGDYDD